MAPTSTVASQEPIDGYLVVAPRVMRSGQKETVSVSLFHGDKPASGDIRLALFRDGSEMAAASTFVQERGNLELALPRLAQGEYQLQLTGSSFTAESSVRIEDGTLLFVESDKPIYKPGRLSTSGR